MQYQNKDEIKFIKANHGFSSIGQRGDCPIEGVLSDGPAYSDCLQK
jgi:hypothetical protein